MAIGVYGQSVIVRKITVPMMTTDELDEQIHWEAEQHIPFDIKVMSIDYEVLRRRPEAGQMDLLLVAAKKDEINDYASILREAKLRPVVVDINAFTIQNIFEHQHGLPQDGTIALLNVGAAVSSLNIVSKGVSAFTREITNAGNAITEEIQKQCGVLVRAGRGLQDAAAARRRSSRRRCTRSSTRRARARRRDPAHRSTSTSRRAASSEISRIYVSGGQRVSRAAHAGDREARARAGRSSSIPMVNLAVDAKFVNEPELRSRAAQLVVALGPVAAMRQGAPSMIRINLLPREALRLHGGGVVVGAVAGLAPGRLAARWSSTIIVLPVRPEDRSRTSLPPSSPRTAECRGNIDDIKKTDLAITPRSRRS